YELAGSRTRWIDGTSVVRPGGFEPPTFGFAVWPRVRHGPRVSVTCRQIIPLHPGVLGLSRWVSGGVTAQSPQNVAAGGVRARRVQPGISGSGREPVGSSQTARATLTAP